MTRPPRDPSDVRGSPDPADGARKFLGFQLGGEHYGFPILEVREIIGLIPITPLPHTPEHVEGVVNLRGRIVPVIDLRRRLGMPAVEPGPKSCIVVVEIDRGEGPVQTGCIVDSVEEVLSIRADRIEPLPALTDIGSEFVVGLAKIDDRVLVVLDMDRVFLTEKPAASAAAEPTAPRRPPGR